MSIKSLRQNVGENAILGALKRMKERINIGINKSDSWPDGWSDTYPFDNYDDFVDFPDATPPK